MMTKTQFAEFIGASLADLQRISALASAADTARSILQTCHDRKPAGTRPSDPGEVTALMLRYEEEEKAAAADPLLQRLAEPSGYHHQYDWLTDQSISFTLETHGAWIFVRFETLEDAALFRLRWA
jgi:hypothetical protein